MATWNDLLNEIIAAGSTHDIIRRKYLAALHKQTGRNVIAYYSGFQQKPIVAERMGEMLSLNDQDINGFMAVIHGLERKKGLDLILHTPGGGIAATESIVDYLRKMFDGDIRAIVPQMAMSAGTMLALACKSIVMGKHSSLGPIDPQLHGVPAHGVIDEFEQAKKEIAEDPSTIPVWQAIVGKYPPTLIYRARQAIDWSNANVEQWLETGMFAGDADAAAKAKVIVAELGSPQIQKVHDRHVPATKAQALGIKVELLEDAKELQDAVLTVHHAFIHTLTATPACKIIENQENVAHIQAVALQVPVS